MANVLSEKLINFEAFDRVIGRIPDLVDVELPTVETPTEEISGAGIAGAIESPTLGHVSPMGCTLKFRNPNPEQLKLMAPGTHRIEVRGSQQRYDASAGEYTTRPLKYVMDCVPKSSPLGTLAPGAGQETTIEFAVHYLKIFVSGKAYLEIDPKNYVYVADGVDVQASVRSDLGL